MLLAGLQRQTTDARVITCAQPLSSLLLSLTRSLARAHFSGGIFSPRLSSTKGSCASTERVYRDSVSREGKREGEG